MLVAANTAFEKVAFAQTDLILWIVTILSLTVQLRKNDYKLNEYFPEFYELDSIVIGNKCVCECKKSVFIGEIETLNDRLN